MSSVQAYDEGGFSYTEQLKAFVAGGLHFRAGHKGEELGHPFVLVCFFTGHHPQAGTADNGVLWRAGHIRVVGQG